MTAKPWTLLAVASALALGGCVERTRVTTVNQPDSDTVVAVNPSAFALQTGFPSDVEIVNQPGIEHLAFVLDGTAVQAITLGTGTLTAPIGISGYTIQTASVFADDLVILSPSLGLATAGVGDSGSASPQAVVEIFNPTTGSNLQTLSVATSHTFTGSPLDTQGNTVTTITQANVAGICFVPTTGTQGFLYVAMGNVLSSWPTFDLYPGTVQVFAVDWANATPVTTTPTAVLTTGGFNPTHVTPFTDPASGRSYVLVSNTGQYQFGSGAVNTPSSIDVIDPTSNAIITNIPLGNAVMGFQDIAIRQSFNAGSGQLESFGLIGSALYGNLYQVDLTQLDARQQAATLPNPYTGAVVNDVNNPIVVSGPSDFITDVAAAAGGRYVFVSSFNNADVRIVDFGAMPVGVNVAPGPFVVGIAANGVSSGAIEIRPGNFSGPEIFGVTGSFPGPDALFAIQTSLKVSAP